MYQQVATKIIKDSIKSAIFIDEKAWEPFTGKPRKKPIPMEVDMSINLYKNFKKNGISLATYRFKSIRQAQKDNDYLFEKRDLVLLDWKLNGNDGAEYSLKLLSHIIKKPNIHFCAIYTSQNNLDEIFWNILSYFSNTSSSEYGELRLNLADEEPGIIALLADFKQLSCTRFEKTSNRLFGEINQKHSELIKRIVEVTNEKDKRCACIKAGIAFGPELKSDESLPCPSVISLDRRTLTINNTVITILNKEVNGPETLIQSFSDQISNSGSSFMQLLGLEMQRIFSTKTSFIDSSILNVSREAFLFHRKQKKEESFEEFVKEVLFEQARLNLRDEKLKLLNNTLLDSFDEVEEVNINDKEVQAINIFYNSLKLGNNRRLNFGDVFKVESRYFICITALCDCLNPKSNVFYFAEGKTITKKNALPLGDTAFLSYLSPDTIIRWTDDQEKDGAHFKPVYIKPIAFTIPKNNISKGALTLFSLNEGGIKEKLKVEYITTIKPNYAQRIANHAFSHPVRVGVDFVKKG